MEGTTAAPDVETPDLVTPDDHDLGQKTLSLRTRGGRDISLTLKALPAREAARFYARFIDGQDAMEEILTASAEPGFAFDRLTPDSYALAGFVAFALAFGYDAQKKILRLAANPPAPAGSTLATPSALVNSPAAAPESANAPSF